MNIDEVEKRLKDKMWKGNPEQAREMGGGDAVAEERRRGILRSVLSHVAPCLMTLVVSIPVTIVAMRPHTDIAGEGTADDPIAYLKAIPSITIPIPSSRSKTRRQSMAKFSIPIPVWKRNI